MPRLASDTRWTWIFATILILVVVVVIGFLSGITSALTSIDEALGTTDADLVEVKDDADPLPGYVSTINKSLTAIDKSLKPIPGQGVAILGSLTSINRSTGRVDAALTTTNSSLLDTSASLVDTGGNLGTITSSLQDTSGSLKGTTNVLVTIRGTLRTISGVLVDVDTRAKQINSELRNDVRPINSEGTAKIPLQVAEANVDLTAINKDTTAITAGLDRTHNHLTSICKSTLLQPLGAQC